MSIVESDDFYVDDEPAEDVARAWKSGEPVVVISSGLAGRISRQAGKLREVIATELRRLADRIGSSSRTGTRR